MEEEEKKAKDIYSFCIPYNSFDINITKSRFPFSKDEITTFLKPMDPGDLIHIMELPISMLQPVSLLEKLSDFLRVIHLLYEKDFESLTEEDKILTILRYYLSIISLFSRDIQFPCNPIVGEIFACYVLLNGNRVSFIAEEQSNRPNTTLFLIEDEQQLFRIQGRIRPKTLFAGSSIHQISDSFLHIQYLPTNEIYDISLPSIHVTHLLYGKEEIQLVGQCSIQSSNNPFSAYMDFIERSSIGGDSRVVNCLIKKGDEIISHIQGRWDIGYEKLDELTKEYSEFLTINELKTNQLFILKDEKQQIWESIQVWKPFRQAMAGGSQESVIKVLEELDKKRKERNKEIEKSERVLYCKDNKVKIVEMKKEMSFIELASL